jgi:hypothetical protein
MFSPARGGIYMAMVTGLVAQTGDINPESLERKGREEQVVLLKDSQKTIAIAVFDFLFHQSFT